MLKAEFEKLYGDYVCDEIYNEIEELYMGSGKDKAQFVRLVKKEHIVDLLYRNMLRAQQEKLDKYKTAIKEFNKLIDYYSTPEKQEQRDNGEFLGFICPCDIERIITNYLDD